MGSKKPHHLTRQGMREQKKLDKANAKEMMEKRKSEKKALRGLGLFRSKDSSGHGSQAFGEMSTAEQDALKQCTPRCRGRKENLGCCNSRTEDSEDGSWQGGF